MQQQISSKVYIHDKKEDIIMSYIKRAFCSLGCILCICFSLSGQLFAGEENKFSKEEIEKFVLQAKEYAIKQGKEKTLKDFMDPSNKQFRHGSLYVFAEDFNGLSLAHIKPAIVGTSMLELKDSAGVMFIKEMIKVVKAQANGGWTEYLWQNPATNKVEKKYTFVIKVDDSWWIGAGVYESEKK